MIARIKNTVLVIALMGMLGFAAQVQAEPEPDYGRPGFYLGAAFALGFENFDTGSSDVTFETAMGVDAWVGYRIIPNLAVELELEYLGGFSPAEIGGDMAHLDIFDLTTNVKGYVLTGRFQPFALIGIGMMDVSFTEAASGWDSHSQAFVGRFGIGMDFYVTENFSVGARGSYVLVSSAANGRISTENLDHMDLTIGAQFRF
jgi:opacity protein-like surface antigen